MEVNEPEAARPLLERALALRESGLGPDHTATGWVLLDLGPPTPGQRVAWRRHGPCFQRALEIQEGAFGPSHPALAMPLTKLATVDRRQGETEPGAGEVREGHRHHRAGPGSGPPRPGCGCWCRTPDTSGWPVRSTKGLETLERALAIVEGSFGTDHVETARVFEGFGYHYYGLQDYDVALQHFDRGREIRERVFGAGHRALGWNWYDRACVLALKGDRAGRPRVAARGVGGGLGERPHPRRTTTSTPCGTTPISTPSSRTFESGFPRRRPARARDAP